MNDDSVTTVHASSDSLRGLREELQALSRQVEGVGIPEDLRLKLEREVRHAEQALGSSYFFEVYERTSRYLDWCSRIPWQQTSEDRLDLEEAKRVLEKHHYGMQVVKDRILEYIAILKFQQQSQQEQAATPVRAPIIFLVGLVGTGKTTFAYALAEAMQREIVRIPFGGMGAARDLRGQSRVHVDSEPGLVIKALVEAKTRNPVILLDEIDRVTNESRMDIMGVLVELLDPKQNSRFTDHFLDYPVDLSQVLFLATANNTRNVATAVLDRMEQIDMPSYTDEEKIVIAQRYTFPRLLAESGMAEKAIVLHEAVWTNIVRPLGFDAGIRTLERTLKGIVAKSARLMVERNLQQVVITPENVKYFLPQY